MNIEKKVKETIEKYHLLNKKEGIAVALSGGKDSTTILYILYKLGYNVEGLMIDLHLGEWSKTHLRNMERFCSELGVKLNVVDMKKELGYGICFIKKIVKERKNMTGCSVCGIVKRWILNRYAKKLGFDKLVTGHNLDDEAHTVLMNFLKGNILLGINSTPSTGNESVKGFVQRVKPLFFIPEDEIRKYAQRKKFDILYDKCPCAFGTYRVETRKWMNDLNLSYKDKLKIVSGFQKIIPKIKVKNNSSGEIEICKECGEPCRKDVCNACKVFQCLK